MLWTWASLLTSCCLSFLTCKMGTIILSLGLLWGLEALVYMKLGTRGLSADIGPSPNLTPDRALQGACSGSPRPSLQQGRFCQRSIREQEQCCPAIPGSHHPLGCCWERCIYLYSSIIKPSSVAVYESHCTAKNGYQINVCV